jgi:hypothetical protein
LGTNYISVKNDMNSFGSMMMIDGVDSRRAEGGPALDPVSCRTRSGGWGIPIASNRQLVRREAEDSSGLPYLEYAALDEFLERFAPSLGLAPL